MRERFLGPFSSPFTSHRFHLRPSARTCTHTHIHIHIHGIHVPITCAFVLTRTAGTLKDAETRNRLQLDSTSRPAGHKTWPRLKRIASSFSLFLASLPPPLSISLAHCLLPSPHCCVVLRSTPNCGLYILATDEKRKRTRKEEKCAY